jgi:peptidoglycan/LPS O-acetylase OafA/YrhL
MQWHGDCMEKKRVFLFDFVRAIATIFIVFTHYNAMFIYDTNRPEIAVGRIFVGNAYIGTTGVSLFLIISGALLYKSYGMKDKVNWKSFYSKRFLTIYPCFWVAYFLIFCLTFFETRGAFPGASPWRIVISILGVDGYLSNFGVPTAYLVGEWFLGFILIVYAVFPLLLFLIKKAPIIFGTGCLAAYLASIIFLADRTWIGIFFFVRLIYFAMGMYFVKYINPEKLKWWMSLPALGIILLNDLVKPTFINGHIQDIYIGIAFFVFFASLAEPLGRVPLVRRVTALVCKYSYACFIIHHWITRRIAFNFDLNTISNGQSVLLFVVCCLVIFIVSFLLHHISERVLAFFLPPKGK